MKEKIELFGENLKDRFSRISKKFWIGAVAIFLILAALAAFILNNKPYEVLVTGVSSGEAASILSFLESQGVQNYKVENNDTILVPKSNVDALKASVIMAGYPQTGYAYSAYYDHVSALSTEAERENAYLMFLMESMSNVIRSFDNVKDATVIISPGEDRGYVLDSGNVIDASASVQVTMSGSARLSQQQVSAIKNLVSHGVQGLTVENVAISDTMGNRYSGNGSEMAEDASSLKLSLEEEYENKIRSEILQAIVPFFGEDNVRVSVNCVVELSQRTVNSRDVQLPEYGQSGDNAGKGIIGSQIYEYNLIREADDTAGGVVGTESNSEIPTYVEVLPETNGSETQIGASGQTDYDNSFVETVATYTAGYLSDCTVAVSINSAAAGAVDLDSIRRHIARAAGIVGTVDKDTGTEYLEEKISVVSMKFYTQSDNSSILPFTPQEKDLQLWMMIAAGGAVALLLILVILILVIRKRRRKKKLMRSRSVVTEDLYPPQTMEPPEFDFGADVMKMQTERSMELRKEVREFTSENPEIAAQMIKAWLKETE
ncbi:MAG: flagellar M-ring protein FliF [Firmicutes bacterium]|nr:flagellar M-ring protein FliF [Bacillota bacterium]